MMTRPCLLRLAASIKALIAVVGPSAAQSPAGDFGRMAIETTPMRDAGAVLERRPLEPQRIPRDLVPSERLRLIDRPVVTMPDGKAMRLPLDLNVVRSQGRRTVVQFGDALMRMHPVRTDLFWIGDDGQVRAEGRNRFDVGRWFSGGRRGAVPVGDPTRRPQDEGGRDLWPGGRGAVRGRHPPRNRDCPAGVAAARQRGADGRSAGRKSAERQPAAGHARGGNRARSGTPSSGSCRSSPIPDATVWSLSWGPRPMGWSTRSRAARSGDSPGASGWSARRRRRSIPRAGAFW